MVADELTRARSAKLAKAWQVNPMMVEIVEVLLDCGGAAHRELIAREIAWRRSRMAPSDGLRREVFTMLTVHCDQAVQAGQKPMITRPFGEESYRWAMTPDAKAFAQDFIASRAIAVN